MSIPTHARTASGLYGPTSRHHWYKPIHYHARTGRRKKGKSRWVLSEGQQYEVFRIADEAWWFCPALGALFSIIEGGRRVLGVAGERLALFVEPINRPDPWHGYPVSTHDQ